VAVALVAFARCLAVSVIAITGLAAALPYLEDAGGSRNRDGGDCVTRRRLVGN
jgi:hypothetical protein